MTFLADSSEDWSKWNKGETPSTNIRSKSQHEVKVRTAVIVFFLYRTVKTRLWNQCIGLSWRKIKYFLIPSFLSPWSNKKTGRSNLTDALFKRSGISALGESFYLNFGRHDDGQLILKFLLNLSTLRWGQNRMKEYAVFCILSIFRKSILLNYS